jgi:hypothetical protein
MGSIGRNADTGTISSVLLSDFGVVKVATGRGPHRCTRAYRLLPFSEIIVEALSVINDGSPQQEIVQTAPATAEDE